MHKRLLDSGGRPGRPEAGLAGLDLWLLEQVRLAERPEILDVGCGFGATLFCWQRRHAGRSVGLTISPYQLQKARREAVRLGLHAVCEFRLQSYDEPIDGCFDLIVSIESLAHSPDLVKTLRNLRRALKPGGVLALVEDMTIGEAGVVEQQRQCLSKLWATERLYSEQDYRDALTASGLQSMSCTNLTDQVPSRPEPELDRSERRLARLRACLPSAGLRRVVDAFRGGVVQERLYARGQMSYQGLIATRPEHG